MRSHTCISLEKTITNTKSHIQVGTIGAGTIKTSTYNAFPLQKMKKKAPLIYYKCRFYKKSTPIL